MLVADLITDPELHLELATPSPTQDLNRPVRAAVVTESMAPTPYLEPDTLLLTTGIGMNFENARIWEAYVERLVDGQVSAVAFAIGQPHPQVPRGLTTAAHAAGLPVLAVPTDVPFLQLQHSVNQSIASERYWVSRQAWDLATHCTRAAGRNASVDELVDLIEDRSKAQVAVLDDAGHRFSGSSGASGDGGQRISIPLPISGEATWELCVEEEEYRDMRTLLTPAAATLSMALSRQFENPAPTGSATIDGIIADPTRQGLTQLASDLADQGITSFQHAQVLRISSRSPVRRNLLAHRICSAMGNTHRTITLPVSDALFVLVSPHTASTGGNSPSTTDTEAGLDRFLTGAVNEPAGDGVLSSAPVITVSGFVLELRRLLSRTLPPGVWSVGIPDITDIADLLPASLHEALAVSVLEPVLASSDRDRMLSTLSALLSTTTTTAAAEVAGVHRNTFISDRHRLERRLAMDLTDTGNRTVCVIALELWKQTNSPEQQ